MEAELPRSRIYQLLDERDFNTLVKECQSIQAATQFQQVKYKGLEYKIGDHFTQAIIIDDIISLQLHDFQLPLIFSGNKWLFLGDIDARVCHCLQQYDHKKQYIKCLKCFKLFHLECETRKRTRAFKCSKCK